MKLGVSKAEGESMRDALLYLLRTRLMLSRRNVKAVKRVIGLMNHDIRMAAQFQIMSEVHLETPPAY